MATVIQRYDKKKISFLIQSKSNYNANAGTFVHADKSLCCPTKDALYPWLPEKWCEDSDQTLRVRMLIFLLYRAHMQFYKKYWRALNLIFWASAQICANADDVLLDYCVCMQTRVTCCPIPVFS